MHTYMEVSHVCIYGINIYLHVNFFHIYKQTYKSQVYLHKIKSSTCKIKPTYQKQYKGW
jgi:hypothetical protein